jgi:TRAP-type C4-dicarboxylate transport system permease small subunit
MSERGGTPSGEDEPAIPPGLEKFFAALAMALICAITFGNVVARYFTNYSFAFTEEFSVFLMVALTFFGTAAAFAENKHIRMSFLVDKLPRVPRRRLEQGLMAASAVMFALLAWYGTKLAWDDFAFETTSPGLGVPQWLYTVWLPLLSVAIVARILGRMIRLWRSA